MKKSRRRPLGIWAQILVGFGIFIVVVWALLWLFQIVLLEPFYRTVKTAEVKSTAEAVEHRLEDESFVPAGNCTTRVEGNTMIVQVPRSALGIGSGAFGITFKVADNLQSDFDITDLYTNGDCAPIGRINYTYRGAALN